MRSRSLTLALFAAAFLSGCHALPSFPREPRVVHSTYFEVVSDLGDPLQGVLPLLDACYEDMCARWGFETLRETRPRVILFADEYDFRLLEAEHEFPPSRTGKCAGFFCTRCDAMVSYFRPGQSAHHPFDEAVLSIVDGRANERLAGVLAHEMNHQLLYDRVPGVGELPAWLVEGVAEVESVRTQRRLDGGFDAWAVDGHSAVRTTLACLNLAAYQLYGNKAFVDGDQVTWAQDRYDLHLAAALALDTADSVALPRLVLEGPRELERLEERLRLQALTLATQTLVRLLFDPHSRFGNARVNVYEVLALLWNRPEWGTFSPTTRRAWRTFAASLDGALASGALDAPAFLTARSDWSENPLAAQARAHGALQRLLHNLEVPPKVTGRWLEDLKPPIRPPSMSGRVLVLGPDGPAPATGLQLRAFPAERFEPASRGTWGLPLTIVRWRRERLRRQQDPTGTPLATATTGADGWYVFKDLPDGDYRLEVSRGRNAPAIGYPLQRTGDLGRVLHVPHEQTVRLRPVDATGELLMNTRAAICDPDGDRVPHEAAWSDDGTLVLSFAAQEWLSVWVSAPGHEPVGGRMLRAGAGPLDLGTIRLRPGGARIQGRVVDVNGEAPAQTVLVAVRDPRTRLLSLAEVKDGSFSLDGLRAGRLSLELFCWRSPELSDPPTRFGPRVIRLDRAPGGTATFTLEIPQGVF